MPEIREIARIKANDTFQAEKIRKELGISQVFVAHCLGTTGPNYSHMMTQSHKIPDKYLEHLTDVLASLVLLKNGVKLLPANKQYSNNKKLRKEHSLMSDIVEFLKQVKEPKVSVFDIEDREKAFVKLIEDFSMQAELLLETIQTKED
jgi:predicted component of type VI protein secretion system